METLFSTANGLSSLAQSTLADVTYSTLSTYEKLRSRPLDVRSSSSSCSSSTPSSSSSSSAAAAAVDPSPSPSINSHRTHAWTSSTPTPTSISASAAQQNLQPSQGSTQEFITTSSPTESSRLWGEAGNQLLNAARVDEKSQLRFTGMTREEVDRLLWDYRTVFTAGTASLVSTAASFPFDSVKSRLQVKHYDSIWACARTVFREEGIQGFFRGVFAPLITLSFVRTSSFSIYFNTKEALHRSGRLTDKSRIRDVALSGMAGGATSGVIISCGSAPFELVKVQRQLEYLTAVQRGLIGSSNGSGSGGSHDGTSTSHSPNTRSTPAKFQPRSGFRVASDILRHHGGIKGFYIGFPLHITRDTLGTALYFGSYDSIRSLVTRNVSANGSLFGIPGPVVSFLSGSTAGILSWLIVYPVDLLKTNVQQRKLSNHPQQLTGYQLFTHLLKERAPATHTGRRDTFVRRFLRLYRGLGVSALRSFISHGLTWTIIEALSDRISKRTGKDVLASRA